MGLEGNPEMERSADAHEDLGEALFLRVKSELLALETPLSTYRLQLHKGFGFRDARAVLPYLDKLGVHALYSSPVLRAMPGSTHGYDVIDHGQLNPELGSPEDHERLCEEVRARRMAHVLDTVPNHMGIERGNRLWDDVLENGPASRYARTFDIEFDPVKAELRDKVLLPVLGDQYGVVLERGELKLEFTGGGFSLRYYEKLYPIGPRGYALILGHRLEALERELGADHKSFIELQSILTSIAHLPTRVEIEPATVAERAREKEVIKRRLGELARASASVAAFIDRNVREINGTPGEPRSFDLLDRILSEHCAYRLAHWRVAGEEINYRRFFDINGLAAVRVEDEQVFEEAHQLPLRLLREGLITGLRIDHPDGLFDPTAYFLRLQERFFLERARAHCGRIAPAADFSALEHGLRERWRNEIAEHPNSPLRKALYVVVEKIQGGRERIPDAWAVHGTTGYRFANAVTGLFVDGGNERALTEIYERFIGQRVDFGQLVYQKKKLILSASMSSEVNQLARELNRISEMNRRTRDFTLNSLRRALVEFIALFPVYRTYVDDSRELDARDLQYIEWTIAHAKEQDPTTNASIFDFLADILLRRYPDFLDEDERRVWLRFAMRLQQVTGPVMAKGLEDTVFYVYNRLVALNEVGGEPERFGIDLDTFHVRNQERARDWPAALLTTSTHDTKRSEDVRARISVLSELPLEWRTALRRFVRQNARHKRPVHDRPAPDANDEFLFYQTVLGAWPMGMRAGEAGWDEFSRRIRDYMLKAIKEAKVNTSWTNPDAAYDEATAYFVERALDPKEGRVFLRGAEELVRRIERPGQLNALGQVLMKLASPGTADVYQGCELWDLSLVDPDNRRPVDFALRAQLLEGLEKAWAADPKALCRELVAQMNDGRVKLFLHWRALWLRRELPEVFRRGDYLPLEAAGPRAENLVAFARTQGPHAVIAGTPRLVANLTEKDSLAEAFAGTQLVLPAALAGRTFVDVFTGEALTATDGKLDVGACLANFPGILLKAI
jgi:(1->4)-alpha-D-glucan 1-alpha-D-glucosylmutase